ncbi:hypothetical protein JOQ06_001203, partial [Pogonophryne albipinna]
MFREAALTALEPEGLLSDAPSGPQLEPLSCWSALTLTPLFISGTQLSRSQVEKSQRERQECKLRNWSSPEFTFSACVVCRPWGPIPESQTHVCRQK